MSRWGIAGCGHRRRDNRARTDHSGSVLRSKSPVRVLTADDESRALQICGADPDQHVFVAARIREGGLYTHPGALLGFVDEQAPGGIRSLLWASANVVPVECDDLALDAFAAKIRRRSRYSSSLFGPSTEVKGLWTRLRFSWGGPRAVREHQPVMSTSTPPSALGIAGDPQVRRATLADLDALVPAAAAMFTEEIGYPPYTGSDHQYREAVATLVRRGHTFVRAEQGRVVFKADVGSVALGVAQIQGVWVAPSHRGQGIAAPAMASVVEAVLADIAPRASLYVNDFNLPARRTYARIGMDEVAGFTTILL